MISLTLLSKVTCNLSMVLLCFQLPHGLPPFSLDLKMEVEKRFLQDPAWMPIHDTTDAFQKFLKYEAIHPGHALGMKTMCEPVHPR